MATRLINVSIMSAMTAVTSLTALIAVIPSPVQAVTFVTDRALLGSNDQIDWSTLGPVNPFNFLRNTFSAKSERSLGLSVEIPAIPNLTPPFVFQTLPEPGIATNFASGDFILFTGLQPGGFPAVGNSGPLSITFDTPVLGAGTQITVDDTPEFTTFISAFDKNNNLLGNFSTIATSSLALDNSALFLGVSSETPNISRLVFSTSVPNRAIGINTLSIAAVPEPTFIFGLLAFSCLGTGLTFQHKLNKS